MKKKIAILVIAVVVLLVAYTAFFMPTNTWLTPDIRAWCNPAVDLPDMPPVEVNISYKGDDVTHLPAHVFEIRQLPFGKPVIVLGVQELQGYGLPLSGEYASGMNDQHPFYPGLYLLRGLPADHNIDVVPGRPMFYKFFLVPNCQK